MEVFRRHQPTKGVLVFGLLSVLLSLGSCQSQQQARGPEPLERRVRGFWEARIAGDDLTAYTYEAYSKTGRMTSTQYVQSRNPTLKYTAYEVKKIDERGDEATVIVDVRYRLIIPARADLGLSMDVEEQWVRFEDGQWYRQLQGSAQSRTLDEQR